MTSPGQNKNMSFDADSATHIAHYMGSVPDTGLSQHSKCCGYPVYKITNKLTEKEYSLGILVSDWKTFIQTPAEDLKLCQLSGQDESHFYACLTPSVIKNLKVYKASKIETYVAQRMICGDDVKTPTKKLEFEIGYQLMSRLSNIMVFKHQENILNFHADFLIELKNNLNRDIPSICLKWILSGRMSSNISTTDLSGF